MNKILIFFRVFLVGGFVVSAANANVEELELSRVQFDDYSVFVFPSCDTEDNLYGMSARSLPGVVDGDGISRFMTSFVSKDLTIRSIDSHLFINEYHYLLPKGCKKAWLIDGDVFVLGLGQLEQSKVPEYLKDAFKKARAETFVTVFGVTFVAHDALSQGSRSKGKNDHDYQLVVGDHFVDISEGVVVVRGKSVGLVEGGETVHISAEGIATIEEDSP